MSEVLLEVNNLTKDFQLKADSLEKKSVLLRQSIMSLSKLIKVKLLD